MKVASRSKFRRFAVIGTALVGLGFATVLSLPPSSSRASVDTTRLGGRVIGVSDGDSITVRSGEANLKVRLAQIDAPETGQPWGTRSRQELAALVSGKEVTLVVTGQDRYGRTIAQIQADGLDVNRDMVARGAAWAYTAYLTDTTMIEVERGARNRAAGLWAMPEDQRIAPWVYRRERRAKSAVATAR
jgi:endonuclease YncB( thermonuclease family)